MSSKKLSKRIYLDNAATTPCDEEVVQAMLPFFTKDFGNASSIHYFGQRAKIALEIAREKVAKIISAQPEEIIFTSGGTESNNLAIQGLARHFKLITNYELRITNGKLNPESQIINHIITSCIEHPSVLKTCKFLEEEGFKVSYIPVNSKGIINLEILKKEITENTLLLSVMLANNEIGTIQSLKEIVRIAKEKNILVHSDAVQAVGNIEVDVKTLGVDFLSLSAHKFYGPKGVGALYIKKGTRLNKLIFGGEQEKDKRAGTENLTAIVGLGKACEIAKNNLQKNIKNITELRNYFINEVRKNIKDVFLVGDEKQRLPNNINFAFKQISGESVLLNLDLVGICASSGSACASGAVEPSYILRALNISEDYIHGSVRFTLSKYTTRTEINYTVKNLIKIVNKLKNISAAKKCRGE